MENSTEEVETTEKMTLKNQSFEKKIDAIKEMNQEIESQLIQLLELMEGTLGKDGPARLKEFWQARRAALELFKETISPSVRTPLWDKFTSYTDEARQIKAVLEEQSVFAVEQIDIAVSDIEKQIQNLPEELGKATFKLPFLGHWLEKKQTFYTPLQKELNILNALATRINTLRKELIKTQMRYRQKNRFFQRLSSLGDHIFPRRKELIKQVSDAFIEDVDQFSKVKFSNLDENEKLHLLRDEIKALQTVAKIFTLNTVSFNHTRKKLSECWEKLKLLEKDRKKIRHEKHEEAKVQLAKLKEKLGEIETSIKDDQISSSEILDSLNSLSSTLKNLHLDYQEKRAFREEIDKLAQPIRQKQEEAEQQHQAEVQKVREEKRQYIEDFISKVYQLEKDVEKLSFSEGGEQHQNLCEALETIDLSKTEKDKLDHILIKVRVSLYSKRKNEKSSSEDKEETLQLLRDVLHEVRARSEELRKISGSSGMDFDQALQTDQCRQELKDMYQNLSEEIEELEKT